MTDQPAAQQPSFFGLGIAPGLLETVTKLGFKVPTPIQQKAIPIGCEGKDVLGIAQTGTGKTLAFGIPMIQHIHQTGGKGLVIVPTRELALQVEEVMRKLGQPTNTRSVILIGGMNMGAQVQAIKKFTTKVLIATPGRLLDHLQQKTLSLADVKTVVLDEADRMFDMGFAPQIMKIAKYLPKERQTLFFSATMPEPILKIASEYMKLPIRIEVAPQGTAASGISQELFVVRQGMKNVLLGKLLKEYKGSVIVFSRTKANAKKVTKAIRELGVTANEIHANRSLSQRREALEGFKIGRYRVLVATDIAARGIDVKGIELVINYDLPDDTENYIHRIGRTGRAGSQGHAIAFATPDQASDVRDIEKLLKKALKISTHPDIPAENFAAGGGNFKKPGQSFQRKFSHQPNRGGHSSHRSQGSHSGQDRPRENRPEGQRSFGGHRPHHSQQGNRRQSGERSHQGGQQHGGQQVDGNRAQRSFERPQSGQSHSGSSHAGQGQGQHQSRPQHKKKFFGQNKKTAWSHTSSQHRRQS